MTPKDNHPTEQTYIADSANLHNTPVSGTQLLTCEQTIRDALLELYLCHEPKMSGFNRTFFIEHNAHIMKAEAAINAHIVSVLENITKANYAEELGTYDFDGIAEGVFAAIEAYKQHQPKGGEDE